MKKTKLLVADDDVFFQGLIQGLLAPEYDLIVVQDGMEAWHELQRPHAPRLAILDWVMPGLSGPQICRKIRASENLSSAYLILLTAKNNESDIISGLRSGADDYITKPPLPAELRARIKMGERVLALQDAVEAQSEITNRNSDPDGFDSDTLFSRILASPKQNRKKPEDDEPTLSHCANHQEYSTSTTGNRGFLRQRAGHRESRHSKH